MTKQRRAISEVIVSLLLLAITVLGGLLVFSLVTSNESIAGLEGNIEQAGKRGTAVKLIGFDTRDGNDLSSLSELDNDGVAPLRLTKNTDFIVVKIRNTSVGTLTIHGVSVNEVSHTWDLESIGKTLGTDLGDTLPIAGEFSMISDFADVQFSTPELLAGQDARLIIKLSNSLTADIQLTEGIRIDIQASDFDPVRFIIPAGSAS